MQMRPGRETDFRCYKIGPDKTDGRICVLPVRIAPDSICYSQKKVRDDGGRRDVALTWFRLSLSMSSGLSLERSDFKIEFGFLSRVFVIKSFSVHRVCNHKVSYFILFCLTICNITLLLKYTFLSDKNARFI